jgi:hypothetical protein
MAGWCLLWNWDSCGCSRGCVIGYHYFHFCLFPYLSPANAVSVQDLSFSRLWTYEHSLRVFENRVLRRIFVPKRKEDGSWRNCIMMNFTACILHRILLGWLNQGGWGGRDMWHAWGSGVYRVLVGKPECKKPMGRSRRWWEDNIKMNLREIGIEGVNWIRLAQDRIQWRASVNTVMNLRAPYRKQDFLTSWVTISFSNNILHHGVSKYDDKCTYNVNGTWNFIWW